MALTGHRERPPLACIAIKWHEVLSWKEVRPRELAERIIREVEPRDDRRGRPPPRSGFFANSWSRLGGGVVPRADLEPGILHDDRDRSELTLDPEGPAAGEWPDRRASGRIPTFLSPLPSGTFGSNRDPREWRYIPWRGLTVWLDGLPV
jgi:hypothetical protein